MTAIISHSVSRRWLAAAIVSALVIVVIGPVQASSTDTVRDQFKSISYDGDDGSVSWATNWAEAPFTDGPKSGQIQVANEGYCAGSNCLRLGPDNLTGRGVYREVDLTGYSQATLTYVFRRQLLGGGDGTLRVRASVDGWNWTTLRTYNLDTADAGLVSDNADLSPWVGGSVKIGFFGSGDYGGYFYVDNVEVSMGSNGTPTIDTPLPDRSDAEGDGVGFAVEASDPDGDDLTFSATGLPPGISIDPDTGIVSGSIGFAAASSSPYASEVMVSDGFGGVASESFVWVVADTNRPPTVDPITDQQIGEGSVLQVAVNVNDPDLPDDSHGYALTTAPPGATISGTGLITWTPTESDGPGIYGFNVEVTDSASPPATATASFDVSVSEVNTAPTLEPVSDQANGVGDTVSLQLVASDGDLPSNTLRFEAIGLPPGILLSETTGLISGTIPGTAQQSSHTVTVRVRDDGSPEKKGMVTFNWQVTRGNHAPVLAAIADQTLGSMGLVGFVATATDADPEDDLSYWLADGIDPIPAGAAIDATSGQFSWSPTEQQFGATYLINVGVSDSGSPRLSDTQLVTITLSKLNQAPSIAGPGDQQSAEGEVVSLALSATDPDLPADTLRYRAVGLPEGLVVSASTGVISGVVGYSAAAQSPYAVSVTATDDGNPNKSDTTSFQWFIAETNRPPVANPITVIVVRGDPTPITLDAEDPDGDGLEYTISTDPLFGTVEGAGANVVYTAFGDAITDSFSYAVSDGEFEATAEVAIEIRSSNNPPTADTDSYEVFADTLLRVDAPGVLSNDSDLDAELLTATVLGEPAHGLLVLNTDGSFTYLPEEGFVGGDKFVYAAADGLGEQATATVFLTVVAPVIVETPVEDEPRISVVVASTPLWQPTQQGGDATVAAVPRAIVSAFNGGISALPELRFPLLFLAIALLLGLMFGRISILPFGAMRRDQEEGWVQAYDKAHSLGTVIPDSGGAAVFVDGRGGPLSPGQRVRFIAAETRGRRLAIKVWPS